jgi:hypothetical protein
MEVFENEFCGEVDVVFDRKQGIDCGVGERITDSCLTFWSLGLNSLSLESIPNFCDRELVDKLIVVYDLIFKNNFKNSFCDAFCDNQ